MTPTIELVHIGPTDTQNDLKLDDVRSSRDGGKSKRIGLLPREEDAVLRFVIPLSAEEVQFAHDSVKKIRAEKGMTVSERVMLQMEPKTIAAAIKKGKR